MNTAELVYESLKTEQAFDTFIHIRNQVKNLTNKKRLLQNIGYQP